jgi:chromosome segregation ATPase
VTLAPEAIVEASIVEAEVRSVAELHELINGLRAQLRNTEEQLAASRCTTEAHRVAVSNLLDELRDCRIERERWALRVQQWERRVEAVRKALEER